MQVTAAEDRPVRRPAAAAPCALGAPRAWRTPRRSATSRRLPIRAFTAAAVVLALTAVTELVVRASGVAAYVFPPPSAVLAELGAEPSVVRHRRPRHARRGGRRSAARRGDGARLRRRGAALTPSGRRPHTARGRVADGAGDRPGSAAGAVVRLRLRAARHHLRAHRLLPDGRDDARGPARHRPAAAPAAAVGRRPLAATCSGACACRPRCRSWPPACGPA